MKKISQLVLVLFLMMLSFQVSTDIVAASETLITTGDEFVSVLQSPTTELDDNGVLNLRISNDIEVNPKNISGNSEVIISLKIKQINISAEKLVDIKAIDNSRLFSVINHPGLTLSVDGNVSFSGEGLGSNAFLNVEKSTFTLNGSDNTIKDFTEEVDLNIYNSPVTITESNVKISNVVFSNNTGYGGGVIHAWKTNENDFEIRKAEVTLERVVFDGNSTVGDYSGGGAIYARDVDLSFDDVKFDNNKADSGLGGAINFGGERGDSSIKLFGGTSFTNNHSALGGGAIFVSTSNQFEVSPNNTVTIDIDDTFFDGNTSDAFAGAIYTSPSSGNINVTLNNSKLINNQAKGSAGALYLTSLGPNPANLAEGGTTLFKIVNSEASNNIASNHGGFAYLYALNPDESLELSFDNTSVKNNGAGKSGGAVYSYSGKGPVVMKASNSVVLDGNEAGVDGGAFYLIADSTLISEGANDIINNIAKRGGGIYSTIDSNPLNLKGVTFKANKADLGGAIYLATDSTISESTFIENIGNQKGGAVYVHRGVFKLKDSTVDSNESENGGGIYVTNEARFETLGGVAIKNNTAVVDGGGIYTENFDDYSALTINDYQNLMLKDDTIFKANLAVEKSMPDKITADYANIKYKETSILYNGTYLNPINNYDINYRGNVILYKVSYDPNGATGGLVPIDPKEYDLNETVTVLGITTLEREGYSFIGWTLDKEGTLNLYQEEDTFLLEDNTTLYAQWKKVADPVVPEVPADPKPQEPQLPKTGVQSNNYGFAIALLGLAVVTIHYYHKKKQITK